METILKGLRNWSEVWALLIPLVIIFLNREKRLGLLPIIYYVKIAFVINLIATIMFVFYHSMPPMLKNNNVLYNLHSFIRVVLLGYYIQSKIKPLFSTSFAAIQILYITFVAFNFIFWESPLFISTKLFAAESIVLLFFTLTFFMQAMKDESDIDWISDPSFMICTGLGLYETVSFFIFLFYYPLTEQNPSFGKVTMTIHNMTFVVMCILLAIAIHKQAKQKVAVDV